MIFGWGSPSGKYLPNSCRQRPYIRLKAVFCRCKICITFWRYPINAMQEKKNRGSLYYKKKTMNINEILFLYLLVLSVSEETGISQLDNEAVICMRMYENVPASDISMNYTILLLHILACLRY